MLSLLVIGGSYSAQLLLLEQLKCSHFIKTIAFILCYFCFDNPLIRLFKNHISSTTGSLGTSVFDMDAFLVGSSGGVYALLAAHLANVLLVRSCFV